MDWFLYDNDPRHERVNTSSLLQKFQFPIEVLLNSLQTQKELELAFL